MSSSIRSSSSVLLALLAVFCITPSTTALPGGLRPRQDTRLPETLKFVPDCAVKCVSDKIAPMNCVGASDRIENCLCGGDPQILRNSILGCIDAECVGHDPYKAAMMSVGSLCKASTTESAESSTGSRFSSSTSTQSSSKPIQSLSVIAARVVSPSEGGEMSGSGTASISTAPVSEKAETTEKESTRLSTPAIIGISVGSFCLLSVMVGAFIFYSMTRKRRNNRMQAKSMTLEPHYSQGETAVGNKVNHGTLGAGVWLSINSTSSTTLADNYFPTNQIIPPADTSVTNEKFNAHRGPNISPMSPVSPIIPQGFEFGDGVQQQGKVIGSRKIIENPHLLVTPAVTYTPASPTDRNSPPIPLALNPYRTRSTSINSYNGDLLGMAISTDLPSAPLDSSSTNRHTCSTIAPMRRLNHPFIPTSPPPEYASPVSESPDSARSFVQISHGPPAVRISRSDTLSWRRELDEAAGRAVTRVLHSEQSVNEEIDAAKRRKSSIPGLDRFSRRLSRDSRADEENSLVGGERSPRFWGSFGSKSSRSSRSRGSPPRGPSFISRRSNSGGSTPCPERVGSIF